MHLKMLSGKRRPFCFGLNVLIIHIMIIFGNDKCDNGAWLVISRSKRMHMNYLWGKRTPIEQIPWSTTIRYRESVGSIPNRRRSERLCYLGCCHGLLAWLVSCCVTTNHGNNIQQIPYVSHKRCQYNAQCPFRHSMNHLGLDESKAL